ncbi:anaphase-promoting complex subunit 2 [Petromyzon marinus]|uniref:anaphase-promoting complex subunit 2 n=1 Tax=Petromyzon marinus TaxID=7757 RepID=UPI003F6F07E5
MDSTGVVSAAWSSVLTTLVPREALLPGVVDPRSPPVELEAALAALRASGVESLLVPCFLELLQKHLQERVVPGLWRRLGEEGGAVEREGGAVEREGGAVEREGGGGELFLAALLHLQAALEPFLHGQRLLQQWGLSPEPHAGGSRVLALLRAALLFSPPPAFRSAAHSFYSRAFAAFLHLQRSHTGEGGGGGDAGVDDDDDDDEDDEEEGGGGGGGVVGGVAPGWLRCPGCAVERASCRCRQLLDNFHRANRILQRLCLLERVGAEAVTAILQATTEQHISRHCRGEYERPFLAQLEQWLEFRALRWLRMVFHGEGDGGRAVSEEGGGGGTVQAALGRWRTRLQYFLYQAFAAVRISELFNIIRDYPESQHALQELQVCLKKTNQKGQLVASLKTALETRLLHPGVNTDDIITLYISAIRALTQLDPTGVTLDVVCQPVRKYLRSREDTVRKIVAGLTDDVDGPSELAGELTRAEPVELEHSLGSDDDGDEPEDWSPPPSDAAHSVKSGLGRRSFDIISLLVSIYGSKEVFINEYHTLLADRILHHFNYNMAREIRNLELLKLRFGDVFMHRCEVMLKDVADSRRINSNILEARRGGGGGGGAGGGGGGGGGAGGGGGGEGSSEEAPAAPGAGDDGSHGGQEPAATQGGMEAVGEEEEEGREGGEGGERGEGHGDEEVGEEAGEEGGEWPGGPAAPVPLNAMILSGEFWPPLKEGKLELPAAVKEVMEAYTREYEKLKAARSLVWKPHLGLVSLDVHLAGGRSLSLSVSPVHAAIIMHFQDKGSWSLQELSEALKVPAPSLRKKLALWQQHRVLREGPADRFSLLEGGGPAGPDGMLLLDSDDDNDSAMASQADQKEEEMQVFWTYIQGMLTNLETLSLERIHSMLKMFAMIGPGGGGGGGGPRGGAGGECDLAELRAFLGRKVKEQQLLCTGGMYKLPKPGT